MIPHGLPQILARYGNPFHVADDKPAWEATILATRDLPRPLPYAYGPSTIRRIRAHRLVVDLFVELVTRALERGVPPDRLTYGGCYCWRPVRGGTRLSLHTWGVAIDLDPARNPPGQGWDGGGTMLHPLVVEEADRLGLVWGGRWTSRPDCMHLQAADGY